MIQERNALSDLKCPAVADRLTVEVAQDCARFSLRVLADDRAKGGDAFGCALPERIGGLTSSGERLAICLGPDEWLLMAPADEVLAIEERFAAGMEHAYSLVDVSHREVGIEVRGPAATLALSSFCALDLENMPSGSATRTILDKAQAVLIKHAPDHYRIEVWQSFAGHLWGLLAVVSREIALGV
ncbi:MAG: sarcosine oxidase subunit gamma [Geminicoccaceae bacterium]